MIRIRHNFPRKNGSNLQTRFGHFEVLKGYPQQLQRHWRMGSKWHWSLSMCCRPTPRAHRAHEVCTKASRRATSWSSSPSSGRWWTATWSATGPPASPRRGPEVLWCWPRRAFTWIGWSSLTSSSQADKKQARTTHAHWNSKIVRGAWGTSILESRGRNI